ncbi:MAG: hypothetical protein Q9195_004713 [Heterodermia aff. obscurata]
MILNFRISTVLLALTSSISAAPGISPNPARDLASLVPAARSLHKRDPCNGDGATYVLYKDYDQNDCPAPNPSNYGDCFPLTSIDSPSGLPCNIFCQQHVEFTYGQEQILPLSICHHPFTCTVTETITKTIQHGWTFNGGFSGEYKASFTAGVSYAYTWSTAKTNTQSLAVTPKDGECGYFAFLPHLVTTCGLVADAPANSDETCPQPKQHYNKIQYGCESDFVTVKSSSGEDRHEGATVFVYVDCGTNAPLPCDATSGPKQDEAYCKPGVALPRDAAVSALNALPTYSAMANATGVVTESFPDPSPTEASLSYLPASYAVTSDAVPEVTPTGAAGATSASPTDATTTSASPTGTSAQASPTATGTCQAGTLDEADCDSLCAGGTCTTGSTALGQEVTTCSDCPS